MCQSVPIIWKKIGSIRLFMYVVQCWNDKILIGLKKSLEFVAFWLKYLYFASSHLEHNVNQQSTDISTKKTQILWIF